MSNETTGRAPHQDIIDEAYGEEVLRAMDIVERDDFYGIVARDGLRAFAPGLQLTAASHVLDLGSGVGGPARFLARTYGCKVTGIDLSAFNHRTAVARTKAASLDRQVGFVLGDALEFPFPDATFTHVFGCESWGYFPDKTHAYRAALRVLRPGGLVAFLEAACGSPVRLQTEELLGPVRYESPSQYEDMLAAAGFDDIRWQDTTALASRDISAALYRLISRRRSVVNAAGEDVYFALLELWAEFLAYFAEGKMTHCGFIATKPPSPDQA